MHLNITIEDHVTPQLLTSALEAYDIEHPNGRKREDRLETFGLLWGYVIPERENRNPRAVATMATVETSALRKNGSVQPDLNSLLLKIEFVRKYWPHLEVVGTFHSHPYENLKEVREIKGWRASDGDLEFWPDIHAQLFPSSPYLAHIVLTVAKMEKRGWALPKEIEGQSGLELSLDQRKVWITSYATQILYLEPEEESDEDEDEDEFDSEFVMMDDLPSLDIPALCNRILAGGLE